MAVGFLASPLEIPSNIFFPFIHVWLFFCLECLHNVYKSVHQSWTSYMYSRQKINKHGRIIKKITGADPLKSHNKQNDKQEAP